MKTKMLLALVIAVGACNDDHSLGAIDRDASSGTNPTPDDAALPSSGRDSAATVAIDTAPLGPLGPVQSWTGWIENYTFRSGSDAVKVSFASDPTGRIVGQIVLGAGAPPPPATDPNVGYPDPNQGFVLTLEGFPYSLMNATITSNRLKFTIEQNEPWSSWCALQTPDATGAFTCSLPAWSGCQIGNTCALCKPSPTMDFTCAPPACPIAINCGKMLLCRSGICICSPSGCRATLSADSPGPSITAAPTMSFDFVVSSEVAMGSVANGLNNGNVFLSKDP